jgi:hypothetical protein
LQTVQQGRCKKKRDALSCAVCCFATRKVASHATANRVVRKGVACLRQQSEVRGMH